MLTLLESTFNSQPLLPAQQQPSMAINQPLSLLRYSSGYTLLDHRNTKKNTRRLRGIAKSRPSSIARKLNRQRRTSSWICSSPSMCSRRFPLVSTPRPFCVLSTKLVPVQRETSASSLTISTLSARPPRGISTLITVTMKRRTVGLSQLPWGGGAGDRKKSRKRRRIHAQNWTNSLHVHATFFYVQQ